MSIIERAAGRLKASAAARAAAEADAARANPATPEAEQPAAMPVAAAEVVVPAAVVPVDTAAAAATAAIPAPVIAAAPAAEAVPAQQPVAASPEPEPELPSAAAPVRTAPKAVEIDLNRLANMGFISAGGGRSQISEQFRMVKRPLIRNAFTRSDDAPIPGNLIMVTSAVPGEGKTFCSINLALSIAMELDHTVLLVDVDVARPSVLSRLGLQASAGLMDVLLEDKLDIGDVMLKTNVDTLSVLPAGRSHPQAAELLASQAMQVLLEEIATRYPDRIVIFDSPPLLVTSEAHVLASKMGQIVLVVEAESTSQQMVKSALDQIKSFQNVSLLYNKSRAQPGTKYGYYWDAY